VTAVANFEPPEHSVVLQTQDWVLNHRVGTVLPGYLMLGARIPKNDLSLMRAEALSRTWRAAASKGTE
jgi:diadenosine tetraphosphate (Ap4A) HIT family hydrolase